MRVGLQVEINITVAISAGLALPLRLAKTFSFRCQQLVGSVFDTWDQPRQRPFSGRQELVSAAGVCAKPISLNCGGVHDRLRANRCEGIRHEPRRLAFGVESQPPSMREASLSERGV